MTSPTPLTPANEPAGGTDPAPLTDEELAAKVRDGIWARYDDDFLAECDRALDDLIANLRASRAEVERLRGGPRGAETSRDPDHFTGAHGGVVFSSMERCRDIESDAAYPLTSP